jgi:hypothetical protein
LVAEGEVDVEVPDRLAVGAVDGDVVEVTQDGDLLAAVAAAAEIDDDRADPDAAGVAGGDHADLGVVLDGQLAGAAEGRRVGPGGRGWAVPDGVPALVVVPVLVGVAQRLQFGQGSRGGWLGSQPGFEGAVVPFDLAAGLRMVRAGMNQPGSGVTDDPSESRGAAAGEA